MGTWSGMGPELQDLARKINEIEFDHVFTMDGSTIGGIFTFPGDVYAPTVTHDDEEDIVIDSEGWEALSGFSGQYSYNGPVMDPSEYIGTAIAEHLSYLSEDEPQTFVVVVVESDEDEADPVGWAILRRIK